MRIGIIVGSQRKNSQSAKVGHFLAKLLHAFAEIDTWMLDLGIDPLPLWDESIGTEAQQWSMIPGLKSRLNGSDGFIFIAPEWHGMVPAALKNFFLLWPASGELAHKPALACGISAGDGGAYVISELRMSGYKNNRLCWIPEHLIARRVNEICNPEDHKNNLERHRAFEERAKYTLGLLISYGNSLRDVRSSGIIDHEAFPNGM